MRIAITGAAGNLGAKLVDHLLAAPWCDAVVGLDRRDVAVASTKHHPVTADLADPNDARWIDSLAGCDSIVHFATRNPAPNCTWNEAAETVAMTARLIDRAADAGMGRFVFASSNHVMGGYKDSPLADDLKPGQLTTDLPPSPGTRVTRNGHRDRPTAYSSSKLYGEALAASKAVATGGKLTAVSVRIGFCQGGENNPATINAIASRATPEEIEAANREHPRDLAWFRGMWLSNRDFLTAMERAIRANSKGWPAPAIVVNGMSANTGAAWDLAFGRRMIGYEPQDDWKRVLG
jgi:nucleoside-diphosphate-sugar epimerase